MRVQAVGQVTLVPQDQQATLEVQALRHQVWVKPLMGVLVETAGRLGTLATEDLEVRAVLEVLALEGILTAAFLYLGIRH